MRELEFLPEDHIRARFQRRIGFIRSWLLLALGLAMVLWSLQMGVWVRDARAELEALQGADSAVEADVTKVRMLRAETRSYTRRLEFLQSLAPRITAAETIAAVADLLPEGVTLDEARMDRSDKAGPDRGTLRLAGQAPSETVVTAALAAIDSPPAPGRRVVFSRATLVESRPQAREDSPRRSFVIEVDVLAPTAAKE